ncbi:MAG: ABC transporter permease, partial [Enhydrobacter sp.]
MAPAGELSNFGRARRRLLSNPAAIIGIVIVISIVLAAILAPYIAPYPGHAGSFVDFRHRHNAPSFEHLLGTDNVGRDILSRILFGYRVSLLLVVGVLGVAVPAGVLFGLLAGYFGGIVETAIMWLTNVMLAVPPLVMALAITAVLTPDLVHSMIAITVLWWTWHCRLVYRVVKSVVAEDFVEAARASGATKRLASFERSTT